MVQTGSSYSNALSSGSSPLDLAGTRNSIDDAFASVWIQLRTDPHAANLFHGSLGAYVGGADKKDHVIDELESMGQH